MSRAANNLRIRIQSVGTEKMKQALSYCIQQSNESRAMYICNDVIHDGNGTLVDRLITWDLTPEGHSHWRNYCEKEKIAIREQV